MDCICWEKQKETILHADSFFLWNFYIPVFQWVPQLTEPSFGQLASPCEGIWNLVTIYLVWEQDNQITYLPLQALRQTPDTFD